MSEELITRLFLTNQFEVVERNLLNKILEEHELNMSGLIDENTIKKLGRLLGVDAIASGSITDLGEYVKVNARLISTETGSVFSVASAKIAKSKTVKALLDQHSSKYQNSVKTRDISGQNSFSIDLSNYEVGDLVEGIGIDLMIAKRGTKKYIRGFNSVGKLTINNLSLRNKFEILFSADWNKFSQDLILQSEDGDEIKLTFKNDHIIFGNTTKSWQKASWKGNTAINDCRIYSNGKIAKFYLNGQFFGTSLINQNAIYTKLILRGIKKDDALFHLSGSNM